MITRELIGNVLNINVCNKHSVVVDGTTINFYEKVSKTESINKIVNLLDFITKYNEWVIEQQKNVSKPSVINDIITSEDYYGDNFSLKNFPPITIEYLTKITDTIIKSFEIFDTEIKYYFGKNPVSNKPWFGYISLSDYELKFKNI